MMKRTLTWATIMGGIMILSQACKHEPWVPDGFVPNPEDSVITSAECDPDTVYFVNNILPLLSSSCAMSGCHDASTAQDGVILDSYFNIMSTGDVDPGDPNGSKIYDVLFESGSDQMPPPGSGITLTTDQKNAIYTWILQGARNNACEESGCDSTNASYSSDIRPILELHCLGCHSYPAAAGGGIPLDSHTDLVNYATNGQLIGAITAQPGYTSMPLGQPLLDNCKIATIRQWINEGMQNN